MAVVIPIRTIKVMMDITFGTLVLVGGMSEVAREISSTCRTERDSDWVGELVNPARIKATNAPVIANFSGCLCLSRNPEESTEIMWPINNNIPISPVPAVR